MSSKQLTLKIAVIGPSSSGKTTITNFLSNRNENLTYNYRPTAGCRILEIEKDAPKNPRRPGQEKVIIELWDVSGSVQYEQCWPSIQKECHGIIMCYNAENYKHEGELEQWVNQFPKKMNLPIQSCIAFAHHLGGKPIKNKSKPPKPISNIALYDTSIEEAANTIIPNFDKFFTNLMMQLYEKQEKEENRLME